METQVTRQVDDNRRGGFQTRPYTHTYIRPHGYPGCTRGFETRPYNGPYK